MTVFASQVASPISVNYDNPATANLLTCQFDDGTTVTNCITGETGETFDSANLIGVAASSGERVSATWSAAKPSGIDSNPFSLLQTQEDIQDDYCLQFNGTNSTYVTVNYTPSGDFKCLIDFTYEDAGHQVLLGMTGYDNVLRINDSTSILIKSQSNSSNVTLTTPLVSGQRYKWYFVRSGSTYDIKDVDGNSLLTSTANNTSTFTFNRIGSFNIEGFFSGKLHAFGLDFDSTRRLWQFNQTHGDTVDCLYTGDKATLVGFPVDDGYVKNSKGDIEAYQLGANTSLRPAVEHDLRAGFDFTFTCNVVKEIPVGETRNISICGDWRCIVRLVRHWSGVSSLALEGAYVSGTGSLQLSDNSNPKYLNEKRTYRVKYINNTVEFYVDDLETPAKTLSNVTVAEGALYSVGSSNLKLFSLKDKLKGHEWDFSTGDKDQIRDVLSTNHLRIENSPANKWQPIRDVKIYTIGSGTRDYPDIVSFGTAQQNASYYPVLLCYGVQEFTADFDHRTTFPHGLKIVGMAGEFKGDTQDSSIAVIKHADSYTGHLFDYRSGGKLDFENIILDCGNKQPIISITQGVVARFTKAAMINVPNEYGIGGITCLFKKSVLHSVGQPFVSNGSSNSVTFLDSVVYGNTDLATGLLRSRSGGKFHADNTLFINQGTAPVAIQSGSNNITNKEASTGIGKDANLPSYFVDVTNQNFSINKAGQTALKGKGWNGSDVAGWAYAQVAALITGTLTSGNSQSLVINGIKISVSITNGTLSITVSEGVDSSGDKQAEALLGISQSYSSTIYGDKSSEGTLTDTSGDATDISGTKESSGASTVPVTISYSLDAEKLSSEKVTEIITDAVQSKGIKDSAGTSTTSNISSIQVVTNKLLDAVIQEILSVTEALTTQKTGKSTTTETINHSITKSASKVGAGNLVTVVSGDTKIKSAKLIAGTSIGTLEVAISSNMATQGSKSALYGSIQEAPTQGIILQTLKNVSGEITAAISAAEDDLGIKFSDGVLIESHTILDLIKSGKLAPESTIQISHTGVLTVSGSKTVSSDIQDVTSILLELKSEAIKRGDLATSNSIDLIVSGVDPTISHVNRTKPLMGTINFRFKPIIGTV